MENYQKDFLLLPEDESQLKIKLKMEDLWKRSKWKITHKVQTNPSKIRGYHKDDCQSCCMTEWKWERSFVVTATMHVKVLIRLGTFSSISGMEQLGKKWRDIFHPLADKKRLFFSRTYQKPWLTGEVQWSGGWPIRCPFTRRARKRIQGQSAWPQSWEMSWRTSSWVMEENLPSWHVCDSQGLRPSRDGFVKGKVLLNQPNLPLW